MPLAEKDNHQAHPWLIYATLARQKALLKARVDPN